MPIEKQKPIRLPLVGNYNTRLFSTGGAFTGIAIVGLAIVGNAIVGNSASGSGSDQRFVNLMQDKVQTHITDNVKYYCYKRPGMEAHNTPGAGNAGSAVRIWTGKGTGGDVISAFGATNSTIYNGTSSIGTLVGVARDITETTIGTVPTLVIPVDNNRLYYYPEGGAMTQVTDVDYPGEAGLTTTGTCVHLNGYTYIMTNNGRIWNSDLNSIADWSATSVLTAGMYPDKGVGLAKYKNTIVAFGRETIEFFKDIGNSNGSPLQRIDDAFIRLGAYSETAITQLEDTVVWVSASDIGGFSIYMLEDFKPVRISDNIIDNKLALTGGSTVYVTGIKIGGKTLFFIIFGAVSLVYCVEDKTWNEWISGTGTILWHRFTASSASSPVAYSISRTSTSGKVYKLNPIAPVYSDDGNTYQMSIQTSKIDLGTENRKFLERLTIVADSDNASHEIAVSWSDDDYTTYSTPRTLDLLNTRKYLNNCGSFRRRAFLITDSTTRPTRFEAIELNIKEGMH